jgi:hypothetical protein
MIKLLVLSPQVIVACSNPKRWVSSPSQDGWGRPAPTLVPWRQGFRLQQGTSVGASLPKSSQDMAPI